MRRISKKRQERYAEYVEIREKKRQRLKQEGKYFCVFCVKQLPYENPEDGVKADCHHLIGRDGDHLIEERYLSFAHRDCHNTYHDKAPENIWWYPLYVKNISNQWPELTNKVEARME